MPWVDEFGFVRWGSWAFLLHDRGWLITRDDQIVIERQWPAHGAVRNLSGNKECSSSKCLCYFKIQFDCLRM